MFRKLPVQMPPDITFPPDLEALGYFVTADDLIRQTANPERKYQYKINRNERVNEVYKEAMNTCSRAIVRQRLLNLGVQELLLPLGATQQDKHLPIFVSPNLPEKKHVIVLFPERSNDLGILSYRILGDEGVNTGSVINLVKAVLHGPSPPAGRPGIIIANPSQLLWYRGGNRPVTPREWINLPRASAVHHAMQIDESKNRIDGNRDFEEHIQYIFEHVLTVTDEDNHTPICNPNANFSIIGLEFPGSTALQYLVHNWTHWSPLISCIAICNPQHTLKGLFSQFPHTEYHTAIKKDITRFIATRTRAYRISRTPVETPLLSRDISEHGLGCNVYSSGEALYEESVFVRCWGSILDWIDLCRFSDEFEEPVLTIKEDGDCNQDNEDGEHSEEEKEENHGRVGKWPRTEEEIGVARFHGEMGLGENGDGMVGVEEQEKPKEQDEPLARNIVKGDTTETK